MAALALLFAEGGAFHVARAGDPKTASRIIGLAASCAACHRTDGRSAAIPPLCGVVESRLLQRMATFRAQTKGDQIMHVVANALSPEETAALARYFAARPVQAMRQ
jgi:sulfide dehydrogenase cytochrome subunit